MFKCEEQLKKYFVSAFFSAKKQQFRGNARVQGDLIWPTKIRLVAFPRWCTTHVCYIFFLSRELVFFLNKPKEEKRKDFLILCIMSRREHKLLAIEHVLSPREGDNQT